MPKNKPDTLLLFVSLAFLGALSGCDDAPQVPAGLAGEPFSVHADVLIPELLTQFDIPGAAIAVMENGEITLLRGYGFADIKTQLPMTAEHVFNVASVSKSVSAWGIMGLVDKGMIDLDQPVNTYLKRWQLSDGKHPAREVTVRRLLSHTGGISMPSTPGFRWPMQVPDLVQVLSGDYADSTYAKDGTKAEIIYVPGQQFHYSGGGYLILQLLIQDVTGKDFPVYMQEEMLFPLGMKNSQFGWDEKLNEQMATPYFAYGKAEDIFRLPGFAASSLHASATDLAAWLLASAMENRELRNRVISDRAFKTMLEPVADTGLRDQELKQMGLGYFVESTDDAHFASHSGGNAGWRSRILLSPDTGEGFVILTNSDDGGDLIRAVSRLWIERNL